MAIELTTLLQHANSVGASQADSKDIFITEQGDISGKTGLGFFKRHFSTSAKQEENRATLQAFQNAILADPKYRTQLETEQVARFFQTKHDQGTPLTARDVQVVKNMLEIEHIADIAKEQIAPDLTPGLDAVGFAWFCVGKGIKLDTPEDVKGALQEYYVLKEYDAKAEALLTAVGIPPEKRSVAMEVLKASTAWSTAMQEAFAGDISDLTHAGIVTTFTSKLEEAVELLAYMSDTPEMDSSLFRQLASSKSPQGISLFEGALAAARGGAIAMAEGPTFIVACLMDNLDLRTPEGLYNATNKYCIQMDAEKRFMALAKDNGLPEGVGKTLAFNPEFRGQLDKALMEACPPPAIPKRELIDSLIERTAAEFLAGKNDVIRELLTLPGKVATFDPAMANVVGQIDEAFICQILNPLLATPALVNHLLNPEKGPDQDLVSHLEEFQAALASCQHTMDHEFGGDDIAGLADKCLALILSSTVPGEDTLKNLLASVDRNFSVIAPSVSSVVSNTASGKLKTSDWIQSSTSLGFVQTIMRRVAHFAHTNTPPAQREAMGILVDTGTYVYNLEFNPEGTPLPLSDVHPSVRIFAKARGVEITQSSYEETRKLANEEAVAFTEIDGRPVVTELLHTRASAIANDIGLTDFNPADLDPEVLGALIARAILAKNNELVSPAQAREISEQVIRDHLQKLKPTVDFIRGLPTEHNPDAEDQLVITPAEKQRLLRLIPGTPLRDPELVKTILLESRSLALPLQSLAAPGLTRDEMYAPLMQISSIQLNTVGRFQAQGPVKDEVYGAYKAALTLALDGLQLNDEQTATLYEKISGDQGLEVGRHFVCMGTKYNPFQGGPGKKHSDALLGCMSGMNNLRMILGTRTGALPEEDPFYYNLEEVNIRDIPTAFYRAAEESMSMTTAVLPGHAALSGLSTKLTQGQWNSLMPIMEMIGKNIERPSDRNLALTMVAASAQELLAAIQTNEGKPLSPAQIWKTVMGDEAPQDVAETTLGLTMLETASSRIHERLQAMFPPQLEPTLVDHIPYSLGQGIPFQVLLKNYQEGGPLTMADCRFTPPPFPSPDSLTPANAYGLITGWQRMVTAMDETPPRITIQLGDDHGVSFGRIPLSSTERVPDNPIFVGIIDNCLGICQSDAQFKRVMQCMSPEGTKPLRMMAELFPGFVLEERAHFDATVTPRENGDVIVELTNRPTERPFGAHIQLTVSPNGDVAITDINLELRG